MDEFEMTSDFLKDAYFFLSDITSSFESVASLLTSQLKVWKNFHMATPHTQLVVDALKLFLKSTNQYCIYSLISEALTDPLR